MYMTRSTEPTVLEPRATPLGLSFTREMGTVVISVSGELDASTCPKLKRSLNDMIEDQGQLAVDLDLAGLQFIDSSGIQLLVDAHRRLEAKGGSLTLRSPTSHTLRVLGICGLDKVFNQNSV